MLPFAQYTGTVRNYSVDLVDATYAAIPTIGPPIWSILSGGDLATLTGSPDGLRVTVKTGNFPGTVTFQVAAQIAGQNTVSTTMVLNISAAPIPNSITTLFNQSAPGPI
jgi:hypothetical protein